MIFDPTDFEAPYVPSTNWLQRLRLARASARRAHPASVSGLPPRLLDDIGFAPALLGRHPRR